MTYSVSSEEPRGPFHISEMDGIREQILEAKGTPNYYVLKDQFEGPKTGLDFREDTSELRIADGWHANEDGYIVKN